METDKDFKRISSGTEDVSSNIEDGGAEAPAPSEPQEAPASAAMVACKTCGSPAERKGYNTKYCAACSAGRHKITAKNRTDRKKAASYVDDSGLGPTKAETKTLLEERGHRILG